jgi:tetratricopeptide (TPR) repeat protein
VLMQAQQGDFGDIEETLWKKVKLDAPETPLILEALARGYTRMSRLGPAMLCLNMLLERDPDNVEALANRGRVYERTTGGVDAIKDYRRVLKLRPDRDDVRLSAALILVIDNPDEARREFEYLLEHQPDNPEVLLGLAQAYHQLGDLDKPRPLIDAVLAKDPDNSKALTEKGLLAIDTGNIAEGEALLRKAIEKDYGNLDAHYKYFLFLRGRPGREAEAAAQRETHQVVEADRKRLAQIQGQEMSKKPYDPNLHYEIGMIYRRLGKPDLGRRWLESAHKLDPSHQPTLRALSEFLKSHTDAGSQPEKGKERSDTPASANAIPK